MGFLDALFGRPRMKAPDMERIFALPAASLTLLSEAGLQPDGRAGLCLKAVDSGEFAAIEADLRQLLDLATRDFKGDLDVRSDEYGYRWVLFGDPKLDELVNLIHLTGSTLQEKGFGEQLLAAVFRFRESTGSPFFLIYHYKRGSFYPFAPTGGAKTRDEALEFRVSAVISREIPVEKDTSRWFPLWDCPV